MIICVTALLSIVVLTEAFHVPSLVGRRNHQRLTLLSAKGFAGGGGGGGFGAATPQKKKTKKAALSQVKKKYGGTTAKDIALGTQKAIDQAMQALPEHLRLATELYQKLEQWDNRMQEMSILQQTNIPMGEMEGAQRARDQLEAIYKEHNLTPSDIHNIFQEITWDASADAKAARAITGSMPQEIELRVQRVCSAVADAVGSEGRCLDVGCGPGTLVPFLTKAGLTTEQIVGMDLSSEMIRNAKEQHPNIEFIAADYLSFEDEQGFDAIVLLSALHDMPDMHAVLAKSACLLRPGGKLLISHPQGASHVLNQARKNRILVKRGLPKTDELNSLELGLKLTIEPAGADSHEEGREGYFAVLEKETLP